MNLELDNKSRTHYSRVAADGLTICSPHFGFQITTINMNMKGV